MLTNLATFALNTSRFSFLMNANLSKSRNEIPVRICKLSLPGSLCKERKTPTFDHEHIFSISYSFELALHPVFELSLFVLYDNMVDTPCYQDKNLEWIEMNLSCKGDDYLKILSNFSSNRIEYLLLGVGHLRCFI